MIEVSSHVKERIDRLISEYENLVKQNRCVCTSITVDNVTYEGVDATKQFVEELKRFRKEIDEQKSRLFEGTFEEVQTKIFRYVKSFFECLPVSSTYEVIRTVHVQKQLMQALRKARKNPALSNEATLAMSAIKSAKHTCWAQDDSYFDNKTFKLVHTSEEFESTLKRIKENYLGRELTPGFSKCFKHIRVAFEEISFDTQYRQKGIFREYKAYAKDPHFFYGQKRVFDFWHGVTPTAIYYVFIEDIASVD